MNALDTQQYSRHIYFYKPNKYRTYKEFQLFEVKNGNRILPEIIRLEKNFGKNKGTGFKTWLRIKDTQLWENSTLVTGLRMVKSNVMEGNRATIIDDKITPESLIILQYSSDLKTLIIDYFKGFYPSHPQTRKQLIISHNFLI